MQSTPYKCWTFKIVSDVDRSYVSIEGYDDDFMNSYQYDQFVPNQKNVKVGDAVLLVDKRRILAVARIERIESSLGNKDRSRCPLCSATNFEARKTKLPKFRCNNGHEFDQPLKEKVKNVRKFRAIYGNYFKQIDEFVPVGLLKDFTVKNRNMSIKRVNTLFLSKYLNIDFEGLVFDGDYDKGSYQGFKDPETPFNISTQDQRKKKAVIRSVREGQQKFKSDLVNRYGLMCMVTGCSVPELIEAAHIVPYRGVKDNHPKNGLLLRSDIHKLFDANYLKINPETLTIKLSKDLLKTEYGEYNGKQLELLGECFPSQEALEYKWRKKLKGSD